MHQTIIDTNIFTIFIFILIISGNFLAQLFPCKLQDELNSNMYLKHIFGLFTMIFFVTLAAPVKDKHIYSVSIKSVFLYVLFMLITKVNVKMFYPIILLLGVTYIIILLKDFEISKTNNALLSKEATINENSDATKNDQIEIEQNNTLLQTYDNIIYYSYITIFLLTIVGVLAYMGEKKIEYKHKFKYVTFFLGKTICKHSSPSVDMLKSLQNSIL